MHGCALASSTQVADRFRRAWLLHMTLGQWRRSVHASAQQRAQEQEAAAAVAAEVQVGCLIQHHVPTSCSGTASCTDTASVFCWYAPVLD
jgi:hypothetical protein